MNNNGTPLLLSNLRPGFQRDGGLLGSVGGWESGQHVRFQNGMPRRMEGITRFGNQTFTNPIRKISTSTNSLELYVFSKDKVYNVGDSGPQTANYTDITPASGWEPTEDYRVSTAKLFDESAGLGVIFYCKWYLQNAKLFYHVENAVSSTDPSITINRGGVVSLQPYLIIYDQFGNVRWSDANNYTDFVSGDAGSDYITDESILFAAPWRGQSVLLWTETELWQMQYVGGSAIFSFSRVASGFDLNDPETIVQYNSRYYWLGDNGCCYMFDGRLNIVPNTFNQKWFSANSRLLGTNYPRVVGVVNPTWGEVWWGFQTAGDPDPRPKTALIFDAKTYEKTGNAIWWDTSLEFHSGTAVTRRTYTDANTIAFGTYDGTDYRVAYLDPYRVNDDRTGTSIHIPTNVRTGPLTKITEGEDRWMHIYRLEPDFDSITGTITVNHIDRKHPQSTPASTTYGTVTSSTEKIDKRVQSRLGQIEFQTTATGQTFVLGDAAVYVKGGDKNNAT